MHLIVGSGLIIKTYQRVWISAGDCVMTVANGDDDDDDDVVENYYVVGGVGLIATPQVIKKIAPSTEYCYGCS